MANLISGMIDVFADTPLSGNPLAVVEGADHLEDDVLRLIAREFNQSETTFILKSDRADRRLRSFTASGAEVFGAGHNALGAWLWLGYDGQLGDLSTAQTFLQEIGDDILPITVESRDGRVHGRMKQASLKLSPPLDSLNSLAEALGLVADDLLSNPVPRAADTGASHLMVRLRDRQTVDRATPSAEKLIQVLGPQVRRDATSMHSKRPIRKTLMHASSIPRLGFGKTRRPERRRDLCVHIWARWAC